MDPNIMLRRWTSLDSEKGRFTADLRVLDYIALRDRWKPLLGSYKFQTWCRVASKTIGVARPRPAFTPVKEILEAAPRSSIDDLVRQFGRPKASIVAILSRNKVRIGTRRQRKSPAGSYNQLQVLASLIACKRSGERVNFSKIGIKHHVTRENVAQVHRVACGLGLITPYLYAHRAQDTVTQCPRRAQRWAADLAEIAREDRACPRCRVSSSS